MNVDVIFATSSIEVEAARQATKTIPIVFGTHADPVGLGHVASLGAARRQHHGVDGPAHQPRRQAAGKRAMPGYFFLTGFFLTGRSAVQLDHRILIFVA